MKKIIISLIVIILVVVVLFFVFIKDEKSDINIKPEEPIAMCYQYSKQTSRGYNDRAWLQMNILDNKITGEYRNLPAETDSKVGIFTGTVDPVGLKSGERIAELWWNSFAEGMRVMEQLNIKFDEKNAVALFGEMIDRGDGTYIYKDINNLFPGFQMSQIDCELLQDMIIVEQYIRDNIDTIVFKKAVLGGSWYATIINIYPSTKTGDLEYEDGHIQGKASFNYVRNGTEVLISSVQSM